MNEATSPKQAPYVSYGIFLKGIETLAETMVPSGALDRRVLSGLSGGDYTALISCLRFLDLIDDQRKATPAYRDLVELYKQGKESDGFKTKLQKVLKEKYQPLIGGLNLKDGTAAELERAFKNYGVSQGQMLEKSIRYFLKAMQSGGVALSPHLTAPKPRAARAASNGRKVFDAANKVQEQQRQDAEGLVPTGYERLPLPGVPNSFIQYPANLTEAHCQILEAMVGVLKTSVKARVGGEKP